MNNLDQKPLGEEKWGKCVPWKGEVCVGLDLEMRVPEGPRGNLYLQTVEEQANLPCVKWQETLGLLSLFGVRWGYWRGLQT